MTEGLAGLEEWFKGQRHWVQDAARRIILNGQLTESDLDVLAVLCKEEAGRPSKDQEPGDPPGIPEGALTTTTATSRFWLTEISNVKGVNALNPRKPLPLGNHQLVIIYGANASGKSGYVRLLKHACGVKSPGTLLGDVYKEESPDPSAEIIINDGSTNKHFVWKMESGSVPDLRTVDIYDTDSGFLYVNEENELTYEPFPLRLLGLLADASAKVSRRLKGEIDGSKSALPALPEELKNCDSGEWYQGLSSRTSDEDIGRRTQWDEKLADELEQLSEQLKESTPSERAKTIRGQKSNIEKLRDDLHSFYDSLSDEQCKGFRTARKDAEVKRKSASEDADKIFSGIGIEGIGTDTWRAMWDAARRYSEQDAYKGTEFPNTADDAVCVLCLQLLEEDAKTRLADFERFVKGELQQAAEKAEENICKIQEALPDIPEINQLKLSLDASGLTDQKIIDDVQAFGKVLQSRKQHLLGTKPFDSLPGLPDIKILNELKEAENGREAQAKGFDELEVGRKQSEARKIELAAKMRLSENVEAIKSEAKRFRHVSLLEKARGLTNPRPLTVKKDELSEELITGELVRRFKGELESLRATRLSVNLEKTPPRQGRVYHRIVLKNARQEAATSDVLSEGEKRVVSLAALLSNVQSFENLSPFIFDDPISSLDIDFEEATVERLVELSKKRQLIVFTHRLSLLSQLRAKAKKERITQQIINVQSEAWGSGEPSEIPLIADRPVRALNNILSARIPIVKKILTENGKSEYNLLAKGICSDVRILIERLIENDLLNDVIERFRRNITTLNKIDKLANITSDDCKFLDEMMTKYSRYEHSQPAEAPIDLPAPEEIEEDIKNLVEWQELFSSRKN